MKLNVLIACEESQAITIEMRKLGHNAFSCDLLECSGKHPEWHINGDAIMALNSKKWDLVIAHPPCTRLCNSGVCWLDKRNLWGDLAVAINFFKEFQKYGENGGVIAIENPIPHKFAKNGFEYGDKHINGIGKYSQIVQPYQFGHTERKATCFWLYGLPELIETKNVKKVMDGLSKKEQQRIHYMSPGEDRAKLRSKTFSGIAEAIAKQFTEYIINKK